MSWGNGQTKLCNTTAISFSVRSLIQPINKFHHSHKHWHKQIFSYIQPSFQKFCKSLVSYRKIRVCQLIIYVRLMQNTQLCSRRGDSILLLLSCCFLDCRRPNLPTASGVQKCQCTLSSSGPIQHSSRTFGFILHRMHNSKNINKSSSKIHSYTRKLCST